MQLSDTHRYASNGTEAVSTIILLANNTQIQIALLYRSPSVPLQALTNLLSRVLNHVSMSSIPCVILGDFNEDLLHQNDSRIVSFMSSHGYTQLVNLPTTATSFNLKFTVSYCLNVCILGSGKLCVCVIGIMGS